MHAIDPLVLARYFALRKGHQPPAYAWWLACLYAARMEHRHAR
jgi:hypothetical protein